MSAVAGRARKGSLQGAMDAKAALQGPLRQFQRRLSHEHPAHLVLELLAGSLNQSEDDLRDGAGSEIVAHARLLVLVGDLGGYDTGMAEGWTGSFMDAARHAVASLKAYGED